nr:DUF6088 family protein [uncultured Sphingorhabdus sp.]
MSDLATRILERIPEGQIVDRASLASGENYDSLGRILSMLVRQRKLVRVGRGLYKRAVNRNSVSVDTIEDRIERKVSRSKRNVFLRKNFEDFGSYDAVGRALKKKTESGRLIQISKGVYAKAEYSRLIGKPAPLVGIKTLATEALVRLGYKVVPSSLEKNYNQGRSTQVPSGRMVAVNKMPRRRIGYDGKYVVFERAR